MVTTKLIEDLGLKKPWEQLHAASGEEHYDALRASSAALAKAIRDGTVTIRQIDKFLRQHPPLTPPLEEFLLAKKAWLLSRDGKLEEALQLYDEALKLGEGSPSTWALKGCALLQLERIDEAFHAFDQAYSLKANFGPQRQGYLKDLLQGWSTAASLLGVLGILQHDSRELQKGVEEYLGVLDKARAENLGDAAVYLKAEEPSSEELQEVIEEWELAVRLLAIKNPFDRWRALTKEMSKVWPKDVSAVDAVREQRE